MSSEKLIDLPEGSGSLKAGEICAIANIEASTMRRWVNSYKLILGDRGGHGHPRYGFSDVVKLKIVKRLTSDYFRVPLETAVLVANVSGTYIDEEVDAFFKEGTHYRPQGSDRALLCFDLVFRDASPELKNLKIERSMKGGGLHADGFSGHDDVLSVHLDITEYIQHGFDIYKTDLEA